MSSIDQKYIDVVIQSATLYFNTVGNNRVQVGKPYPKGEEQIHLDCTGLINITGGRNGIVYVTCKDNMLYDLVKTFSGMEATEEEDIIDMSGELINTISGNMQSVFGKDFDISTPGVYHGIDVQLPPLPRKSTSVIPVSWKDHHFFIVIGME